MNCDDLDKLIEAKRILRNMYEFLETYGSQLVREYEGDVKKLGDTVQMRHAPQLFVMWRREPLCVDTLLDEGQEMSHLLNLVDWQKDGFIVIVYLQDTERFACGIKQ